MFMYVCPAKLKLFLCFFWYVQNRQRPYMDIIPTIEICALDLERKGKLSNCFSIWVFFHEHSRITGLQGKGESIFLTRYYHLHPLQRQLDISRAIPVESSPPHIAISQTRTGNL